MGVEPLYLPSGYASRYKNKITTNVVWQTGHTVRQQINYPFKRGIGVIL